MRISLRTRASGAHVRHTTLRGSLLATFSVRISLNMLLISGALMVLHDHHPSLFDMLTQTDFFLSLVTAKQPQNDLKMWRSEANLLGDANQGKPTTSSQSLMTSAQNLPEYKVQKSRKPPEFTQPQQSSHFNSSGNGSQVGM